MIKQKLRFGSYIHPAQKHSAEVLHFAGFCAWNKQKRLRYCCYEVM